MNVISLPENVGKKDPLSKGILPEVDRRDDRLPLQRRRRGRARAGRPRRRGDHPRADPAQHRRRAAAARLPRAAARAGDEARHGADLRRGDHRLPARARRLPVDRRRHARPDDDGQGDGQRLAGLRARRQGRADGSLLDDARAARRSSPARSTATRRPRRPRWRRSTSSSASRCTSTSSRSASGRGRGCASCTRGSACRSSSAGFGSVFVTYFLDGPVTELRRPARERRRAVRRLPPRADEARDLRAAAEPEAQPLLVRAHGRRRRPAARGDRGRRHDGPGDADEPPDRRARST